MTSPPLQPKTSPSPRHATNAARNNPPLSRPKSKYQTPTFYQAKQTFKALPAHSSMPSRLETHPHT